MRETSFPTGFLWGGGISGNQTEGGWDVGGKGLSVVDCVAYRPHIDKKLEYRKSALFEKHRGAICRYYFKETY